MENVSSYYMITAQCATDVSASQTSFPVELHRQFSHSCKQQWSTTSCPPEKKFRM